MSNCTTLSSILNKNDIGLGIFTDETNKKIEDYFSFVKGMIDSGDQYPYKINDIVPLFVSDKYKAIKIIERDLNYGICYCYDFDYKTNKKDYRLSSFGYERFLFSSSKIIFSLHRFIFRKDITRNQLNDIIKSYSEKIKKQQDIIILNKTQQNEIQEKNTEASINRRKIYADELYVVEFSNGVIKVGKGNPAIYRIKEHIRQAAIFGAYVVRYYLHQQKPALERDLIRYCQCSGITFSGNEYFVGVKFEDAVSFLLDYSDRKLAKAA